MNSWNVIRPLAVIRDRISDSAAVGRPVDSSTSPFSQIKKGAPEQAQTPPIGQSRRARLVLGCLGGVALLASPLCLGALAVPAGAGHGVAELRLLSTVLTRSDGRGPVGALDHPEVLAVRTGGLFGGQIWPPLFVIYELPNTRCVISVRAARTPGPSHRRTGAVAAEVCCSPTVPPPEPSSRESDPWRRWGCKATPGSPESGIWPPTTSRRSR